MPRSRNRQLSPQVAEVVDLAVEDDPASRGRVLHGLVSERREVKDGETCVGETDVLVTFLHDRGAGVIWPAMGKRSSGPLQEIRREPAAATDNAEDSTHTWE
jgi:hypothetical protein